MPVLYNKSPVSRGEALPWGQNFGTRTSTCGGQNRGIEAGFNPKTSEKEKKLGPRKPHFYGNGPITMRCDNATKTTSLDGYSEIRNIGCAPVFQPGCRCPKSTESRTSRGW